MRGTCCLQNSARKAGDELLASDKEEAESAKGVEVEVNKEKEAATPEKDEAPTEKDDADVEKDRIDLAALAAGAVHALNKNAQGASEPA
jgi:hypothetical protein